jgi:hypothetical protein
MANNKRLNHDLPDVNDEHDSETSNHNNQKNHSADNVPLLRLQSSFRNPCQVGVHKKALDIMLMFRFYVESVLSEWLTFTRNSHGVTSSKPICATTT